MQSEDLSLDTPPPKKRLKLLMKNLDFELESRFPPLKTPRRALRLSLETTLHTLKLPPRFCLCLHSKLLKFPLENVSYWDEACRGIVMPRFINIHEHP